MRVLVLTPDFPPAPGGIQLLVHRVVSEAPGLESRVVTFDTPGAEAVDAAVDFGVRRICRRAALPNPAQTLRLNRAAVAEAIGFRPQAVLSAHTVMSPAASLIRRTLGVPVVQYFHGKEVGVRPRLAGFAARNADVSVVVSGYTRGLVEAAGGDPRRIRLIHPGVDIPPPSQAEREARPTVLTVARMEDRYKGHDVMVRAMSLVVARVPDAQWIVIGDGPLRPAIRELARANGHGDDAVRLLGAVDDAERDSWLRRAHVFAMPSRMPAGGFAGEGFGIVYLEANAHGCPAVAGNVGGSTDAVIDGETGLLVDAEDHVAVGDALTTLLTDETLRRRMGEAGEARAAAFAWPLIAGQVADTLRRAVADAGKG